MKVEKFVGAYAPVSGKVAVILELKMQKIMLLAIVCATATATAANAQAVSRNIPETPTVEASKPMTSGQALAIQTQLVALNTTETQVLAKMCELVDLQKQKK